MSLPPVEIKFSAVDVGTVRAAFRTIEDAARSAEGTRTRASSQATKAETTDIQKLAQAYRQAQKDARDLRDAQKAMGQGPSRNIFGDTRRDATVGRGLREYSASMGFEQMFGKTTAQMIGLHGAAGIAVAGFKLLHSAVSLASTALTSLGGWILSDIIKPQLQLETKSTQIANRMGGSATGAGVQDAINALYAKNPQAELADITKAYGAAADLTKDPTKANQVTSLALTANKAYGFDTNKLVEYIGKKRSALSDLPPDQFAALISSQIAAGAKGSGSVEDLAGSVGKQEAIAAKFGTYGGANSTVAKETQIASIINAATSKGMSGAQATTGLANLVEDLKRDPKKFGGMTGPDGQLQRLDVIIPKLIATAGGNLNAYAPGKKGGALADVQIGALSNGSRNFLDALQLGDTFKQAGGGDAGTKAVTDKLAEIFDTASASSKLADDAKKVEATTSMQLEQAWRDLKVALTEAVLPALKSEGPKVAAMLKSLVADLATVDLVGVFKTIGQGMASVLYEIMKLTGKGDPEQVKKMGQLAGVLPKDGDNTPLEPSIIDRALNPDKHQLGTAASIASGIMSPGDLKAQQLAEGANATGSTSMILDRGIGAAKAMSSDPNKGLTDAFSMANQKIGTAADKLSVAADKLAGTDPARTTSIGGRAIVL